MNLFYQDAQTGVSLMCNEFCIFHIETRRKVENYEAIFGFSFFALKFEFENTLF